MEAAPQAKQMEADEAKKIVREEQLRRAERDKKYEFVFHALISILSGGIRSSVETVPPFPAGTIGPCKTRMINHTFST